MSEPKWTPGPWHWVEGMLQAAEHEIIIWPANSLDDTDKAASLIGACGHSAEACAEANMRLIAAAPELYAALDDLVATPPPAEWGDPSGRKEWERMRTNACAALTKARGETS